MTMCGVHADARARVAMHCMKNKKLQRKTEFICVAKIRTLCAVNVDINPVSRMHQNAQECNKMR